MRVCTRSYTHAFGSLIIALGVMRINKEVKSTLDVLKQLDYYSEDQSAGTELVFLLSFFSPRQTFSETITELNMIVLGRDGKRRIAKLKFV